MGRTGEGRGGQDGAGRGSGVVGDEEISSEPREPLEARGSWRQVGEGSDAKGR